MKKEYPDAGRIVGAVAVILVFWIASGNTEWTILWGALVMIALIISFLSDVE